MDRWCRRFLSRGAVSRDVNKQAGQTDSRHQNKLSARAPTLNAREAAAEREEGGGGGMVGLQLSAKTVGWRDGAEEKPSREPGRDQNLKGPVANDG